MSIASLRAQEASRADTYLAGPRNRDLPEVVRRWVADGEGENQDEFVSIVVGVWRERSSFSLTAPPMCECCAAALPEGHHPVRVHLAESATCHEFRETVDVCPSCSEAWAEAEEALARRVPRDEAQTLERARAIIKAIPANDRNQSARAKALQAIDELFEAEAS